MEFVEKAVIELITNQCVIETKFKPFIVNPLTVSINKEGKKRLILDLRIVNKCIWKEKISFEDWKIGLEYFEKDAYCFKWDLSKGYLHINIFPAHQTTPGFSINNKYYFFTVLAFGLSSGPYIFTKVMREMVKYWRKNSIKTIMFLDDGWGTNKTLDSCIIDANFVKSSLESAGFLINAEKFIWVPTKVLEWIGLVWDSLLFKISIPERRILDLKITLDSLFKGLPFVSARILAKFAGKIISLMPVVGNIARLMTRHLYRIIESRKSWDGIFTLDLGDKCISELNFWKDNLDSINQRFLTPYCPLRTLVYSDASSHSCGAFIVD